MRQLLDGHPDGSKIGASASELIGFHGATPIAQAAHIVSIGTTATTAILKNRLNAINSILINKGLEAAAEVVDGGGGEPAAYTGPLDIVSGAIVAYGQRALSAAKLGTALYTLRENSGNTTQAFNSDAVTGLAPLSDISTFLNGATGFVTSWADQSATGNDAVQATTNRQPQWSSAGPNSFPVFTNNAGAALNKLIADGSEYVLPGAVTAFFVFKAEIDLVDDTLCVAQFSGGGNAYGELAINGPPTQNTFAFFDFGDDTGAHEALEQSAATAALTGAYIILEIVLDNTDFALLYNGHLLPPDSTGGDGVMGTLTLTGGEVDFPLNVDCKVLEWLAWPAALSSLGRLAIRQNIAAAYGITLL